MQRITIWTMKGNEAIGRLAEQIEAAHKAEGLLTNADGVATARREGACELHRVCAEFVDAVNSRLSDAHLDLSPPTYSPDMFRERGSNLIQISSQGRQIQIAFEATSSLVSTEKFSIPYILEGEVRAYNQRMLERSDVRADLLFFCVDRGTAAWRFFDWRTLRTGPVGHGLLATLMEPLF